MIYMLFPFCTEYSKWRFIYHPIDGSFYNLISHKALGAERFIVQRVGCGHGYLAHLQFRQGIKFPPIFYERRNKLKEQHKTNKETVRHEGQIIILDHSYFSWDEDNHFQG